MSTNVTFHEDTPFYPITGTKPVPTNPLPSIFPIDPILPVCSQGGASSTPCDNTLAESVVSLIEPALVDPSSISHTSESLHHSGHEKIGSSPKFGPHQPPSATDKPLFTYSRRPKGRT